MNKLFTKIAAAFVGMAMAIGVGVAVASNREVVPAHADTQTAEFAPSNFSGQGTSGTGSECSATIGSITVSTDKGYGTTQFRVYSGATLTIESSAGNISAIDFTTNSSYGGGLTDVSGLSQKTWTKTTSGQARITSIIVTYDDGQGGESTTYSVYYNANGGTNAPSNDLSVSEDDAKNYTLAGVGSMSRDGYTTDGWATSENGTKAYDFEEEVDLTSISTNKSLTLYAHWNKILTPNKIIFANEGLTNAEQYTTFGTNKDSDNSDRSYLNFTVEFSGGSNDGKYYDTGAGIRLYKSSGVVTITAKNNKKLESVTFTWNGSYKPVANNFTTNNGTYNPSTGVWTGLSNQLILSNTHASADPWRLQSIEIAIGITKVTDITLTPSALNVLSDNLTAQTIEVDVEPNDADNLVLSINKGEENVATVSKTSLTGDGTFTVTGKGLTSGSQTVTVSATDGSGVSATLILTAVDASTPVLTGVTVDQTGLTHKTQYVGNAFNPEGLVFTPVYNKPNENPITIDSSDFDWSTLVAGQDVIGTYKEDQSILVTIDTVTVKNDVLELTLTGDELTNPNFLTTDSWNHNGITATAGYESGAAYTGSIEWTYSPATPAAMGPDDAGVLTITATAGTVSESVDVLVTVSKPREVITSRVDTLNREFTGVSDQTGETVSYVNWSDKAGDGTGFKYSGNSAGDKNSIQLRSNNNNSGIITTTSTGYAKSVKITFNSNTSNGRVVQVYGKNVSYSAPSDLYNNTNKGDLLGSATLDSSKTYEYTIEIEGDYFYVGIRSSSGALYLDSVEITYNYVHAESDVAAVDNYIADYMHLDYDNGGTIGSTKGNGSCANYYDKSGNTGAKYHFTQLTATQKEIILKSTSVYATVGSHEYKYNEIRDRLSEWARINGDTLDVNTGVFNSARMAPIASLSETTPVAIVVIVSMVSITAIGGYFFIRKRKEQ